MSVDTLTKRKSDAPSERKSKKPRTSEGKMDKHSKPRSSDKHKSHSSEEKSSKSHRRSSDIATTNDADSDDNAGPVSAYRRMFPFLHMAVPPVFSADPARALAELFDTMLLQYVPELEGVLVTHHTNSKSFKCSSGRIEADGAFGLAPAKVGCLVWSPRIGMKLEGKISLSSPSHVSLLIDGLFNASISSQHIDLTQWEFVHDEQEEIAQDEEQDGGEEAQTSGQDEDADEPRSLGYWRNKKDLSRLGSSDGKLTFTVVSMTVAKRMLTLHGSLLPRPFSVPPPDDQSQSIDAMLPPMEGAAREMNVSEKILHERKMRLFEQRRERLQKAKEEKKAETPSKAQNKRVRWDDDEPTADPSQPGEADKAPAAQGTKITFD